MQTVLVASVVCLLTGGGVGYWLGSGMESGSCAKRELVVATAYNSQLSVAVEATREHLETENRRTVERAKQDAVLAARRLNERSAYELAIQQHARSTCDRDPGFYDRMLDRVHRANDVSSEPDAAVLSEGVPGNPGADRPK